MGKRPTMPSPVRLALIVLLNHIQPGWENSADVIRAWLNGELDTVGIADDQE